MIWFTADTHFGHGNILRYSHRPFAKAHEMDETLIQNWNSRVKPGDTVYHLGDVSLCAPARTAEIIGRLNGTIHLIRGNHDKDTLLKKVGIRFASINPILEIQIPDAEAPLGTRFITLCHYAMRTWNKSHWRTWHLYGHSHGTLPDNPHSLSFDVGVDCHNYTPLSYAEVKVIMAKKQT